MRLRLMSNSSGAGVERSTGLRRSVGIREHVRVVLVRTRLQAREILLDEYPQRLRTVDRLLTFDRHLIAVHPALHDRRGKDDGDRAVGEARARLTCTAVALERIAEADAAAEVHRVAHLAALRKLAQLALRDANADRITTYPELHRESSFT